MSPEINVTLDKRRKLPYYLIKVDDELIDKQVESYTNRFGTNVAAEEVGEKETVRGDFAELDADGNVVDGGITADDVLVSIDLIKNEDIKKQFIGAKVGDVIRFNPKVAFENDHEVGHMLNLDHDASHELNAEFNYTINVINTFVPAEVNEEMVTKIYGEDSEVKTVEDMRNKIAEELKDNLVYSSDYRFLVDAKEVLTNSAKIELPEAFLKRWLVATNENLTAEQIDTDFENFRTDLEWQLIKNKLGKENELKVEEAEIREMAREMALMQFRQYGMMDVPDEHLDQFANSILQNEEERRRMVEKKLEDKILEVIKEKVNIEEKEVSQEEFDKLFEK
jgi:trigger factor